MPDQTRVESDVTAGHDFIGHDVIYQASQAEWREYVYVRIAQLDNELKALQQRFVMTILLAILAMAVFGGLTLRGQDRITSAVEANTRAINALEWRVMRP